MSWRGYVRSMALAPGPVMGLVIIAFARALLGAFLTLPVRVYAGEGATGIPAFIDVALILAFGSYFVVATLRMSRWPMVAASFWIGVFLVEPLTVGLDPANPSQRFAIAMRVGFLVFGWGVLWYYRRQFNWGFLGENNVDPAVTTHFD